MPARRPDLVQTGLCAPRLRLGYEDLWFTWSNPVDTVLIYLNGQECPVTRNPCQGPQYLRLTSEPETLWIDRICVNKRDMREREVQTQPMVTYFASPRRPGSESETTGHLYILLGSANTLPTSRAMAHRALHQSLTTTMEIRT